ncbi:hypothetical protein BTA51_28165 [Hahella sp. CCB-MM4]|uniref:radical SAM protein n=1 Tax=Hahella sp. (strain CCB-MM4) TaxID=1926491 RepID=UPI000B9A48C9|nr:radical SAM protein [Hahella sp. CCB-MM4]OZG70006.1 hypothetical protein BTA51_28165 [Hahella sp. CCB-MM4]
MAVTNYIFKVASRCNADCSYCYVYHKDDQTWKGQPRFLSLETFEASLLRIADYWLGRSGRLHIGLHGGEPFIAGARRFGQWMSCVETTLKPRGIEYQISVQTNGILCNTDIMQQLRSAGAKLFVSCDGPPGVADLQRVDHLGRPFSRQVKEFLSCLQHDWQDIYGGILAVIDPDSSPEMVMDYLEGFQPPLVDLLLPLILRSDFSDLETFQLYQHRLCEWLERAFLHYLNLNTNSQFRYFDHVLLSAASPPFERAIPFDPRETLVIESNGDYHLDDTLRICGDQFTATGKTVFEAGIPEVISSQSFQKLNALTQLPPACRQCDLQNLCGGGLPAHRWDRNCQEFGLASTCPSLYQLFHQAQEVIESFRQHRFQQQGFSDVDSKKQRTL